MFKLSPSTLSLFSECPRCFWLSLKKNHKRPKTPFPSLPNGIDKVLKEYFIAHAHTKLPLEIAQLTDMSIFADLTKLTEWQNPFKGIRYTNNEGHTLFGGIDMLLKDQNGAIIVLDFKTKGSKPMPDSEKYYIDQLSIYTWLFAQNGHTTTPFGYILFFYPEKITQNGIMEYGTELKRVELTTNVVQLFNTAIACLEGDIPQASNTCEYCKWYSERKQITEQPIQTKKQLTLFDL